ncbi:MAG: 3-oxoacyl-ACP synthase [Cyanobacteria bacterium DS2.3.42]|nr:3-oxoacyl-ACP synthase [Cyanobacteria bacterium DS2.3.42]
MKFAHGARLIGVGAGLPSAVVTNFDLEKLVDTSDEWIKTRTGISERRIASDEETTSQLAIAAAKDAIAFAGIDPNEIELVVVATSTPDNLYPSTACMVQAAVGAKRAAAFDMEAACTGIVYALAVAQQFIGSGTFKCALVIGVDIHSRFLNWADRNTCILFGDGAGAFILQADDKENEMLGTYLRADGSGGHLLHIPNTGSAYPHAGVVPPQATHGFLEMNGKAIYEFAVNAVPEAVRAACSDAGIGVEDVDFLIPHQANMRIIKSAAERLGMGPEKIISNVNEMGNTSAASIPLAMWAAIRKGQISEGSTCALVGFGGGLTWGAAIVKWTAVDQRKTASDQISTNKKVEASKS